MLKRLQRKFVILTTTISLAVILIIAFALNTLNYYRIMNNSDAVLELLIENDMKFQPSLVVRDRFSQEIAYTTRYFVVGTDGNLKIDFVDTNSISSISPEYAVVYAFEADEQGRTFGTIGNFRYVKTEEALGETFIFLDIEEEMMSFYSFINLSALVFVISVLVIFVLSCLFSRFAVAPIAKSYERQKRFITDVSHEFKTPLSIIRADSDVIEIEAGESEWTQSIKNQIMRLDTLVQDLITLTKLEEQSTKLQKEDFVVSDLLLTTLEEFSSSAQKKGVSLAIDVEQNIIYKGNAAAVGQLFELLTENAIKYALPDTTVNIKMKIVSGKKIFSIENHAENITAGKYNDWFERFYREDVSRNSDTKGFGIGLSVAKSICDTHGAKITAESRNGETVVVSVVM